MNLHRALGKPDWSELSATEQSGWQRLAAGSAGVVTPGNLMTLAGLIVVLYGLKAVDDHHYYLGLAALIIGRVSDVIDGWLAQRTSTKSPLGELFDASVDKVTTALTLLVFYGADITPGWVLIALAVPHIIITGLAAWANARGQRLHPSRLGKLSMATAWVSLVLLLLLRAAGQMPSGYHAAVYGLACLSSLLGLLAARSYVSDLRLAASK